MRAACPQAGLAKDYVALDSSKHFREFCWTCGPFGASTCLPPGHVHVHGQHTSVSAGVRKSHVVPSTSPSHGLPVFLGPLFLAEFAARLTKKDRGWLGISLHPGVDQQLPSSRKQGEQRHLRAVQNMDCRLRLERSCLRQDTATGKTLVLKLWEP